MEKLEASKPRVFSTEQLATIERMKTQESQWPTVCEEDGTIKAFNCQREEQCDDCFMVDHLKECVGCEEYEHMSEEAARKEHDEELKAETQQENIGLYGQNE